MSDGLESFSPNEGAEGVDAGALERMREQMQRASQQMKRDQQQEAKQKKKEDDLFEILKAFLQKLGPKSPIVQVVSKALSQNITAELILAILSLRFNTIQQIMGLKLLTRSEQASPDVNEKALINPRVSDEELPLHIRINLDSWLKTMNNTSFEKPVKNVQTLPDTSDPAKVSAAFVNLASFVAQDYLESEKIVFNAHNIINFMRAFGDNLVERLRKHINDTKEIEAPSEDKSEEQ